MFGPYEYIAASGELRKHGIRLRLATQPLRILDALLIRPGELVAREEIQQRLWKETTFVDFEHGLNAAVNKLRQTLGDSADKPRYIETIAGKGYRFVAAVETGPATPSTFSAAAGAPALPSPPTRSFRFSRHWAMTLTAVAVSVVALTSWSHFQVAPVALQTVRFRAAVPSYLRLSSSETFALSPDGSMVVYHATGADGILRLWVQRLNSLEPKVLPGTESTDDPPAFWAPDSKRIAFYSNGELRKTDLTGGEPQTICKVPGIVSGGSWNRRGDIIFGPVTGPLMRVSENGGTATAITSLSSIRKERNHLFPVFLPDGSHFLYSRLSSVAENNGIYLGSLKLPPSEQESKRLVASPFGSGFVASNAGEGFLLYLRDGTLWARKLDVARRELTGDPILAAEGVGGHRGFGFFSASANGVLVERNGTGKTVQLAWFDRHGKLLEKVWEPLDVYSAPVVSPDRTQIAVPRFERGVDIWIYNLERHLKHRLTSHPALDRDPIWSPDGGRIAYSSSRSGQYDLYQTAASGQSADELLYSSSESKFPTSWSADGRYLLYQSQKGDANWDVSVLALSEGNGEKRVSMSVLRSPANEKSAAFSPDLRWIAYTSDESGSEEVYVQQFVSTGDWAAVSRVLVSRGGGSEPTWPTEGKEILYRSPDGSIMSVSFTSGLTFKASPPLLLFRPSLTSFSKVEAIGDGNRFLISTPVGEIGPQAFTVVLNWQAELKR